MKLPKLRYFEHVGVDAEENPGLTESQAAEVIRQVELHDELVARVEKANLDVLVATRLGLSIQSKLESAETTIRAQLEAAERMGAVMAEHAKFSKELTDAFEKLVESSYTHIDGSTCVSGDDLTQARAVLAKASPSKES